MTRRAWLGGAVGVAALAVAAAMVFGPRSGRTGKRPGEGANVLLLTLDTLRADRVGAYDSSRHLTPNLDRLAASGIVFEEALASVPLTLPSHATILSGLEPTRHAVHDNGVYVFPREPETLATLLQARGYVTGAFVGAYVLDRRFGLARGFSTYDDRIERRAEGASELESERSCEAVIESARAFLGRPSEAPFLAWVHFYDAHAPYAAPKTFGDAHPDSPYDAEIAHLDACVGTLLEAARASSRRPLLVAVVGDHGESLGEHGELTHGFFVYQSTLCVPFLLAGPGVSVGERRRGPARTADILPTLLGRLGVTAPSGLDGRDLLAEGAAAAGESYAETLYPRTFGWSPLRSFRLGAWKLIDAPRPELYDVSRDPAEANDLAAREADRVRQLQGALAALRASEKAASSSALDPEAQERLKALGYVAAAPAPATSAEDAARPDPKDRLVEYRAFEEASWAAARGEHDAAIAHLRPLLARDPRNPVFARSLAASLRKTGRGAEASRVVAESARGGAGDPVALHEQAMALAGLGRTAEAIAAEEQAIRLNPLLPEPLNHLGTLEAARGRVPRALELFDAALAVDPNNAKAWNNRGNALSALGRGDDAAAAFRKAMELRPADPDPINGLGSLLVRAGRTAEAEALFRRALERDPGFAEARLNLAVALAQQGRLGDARTELQRLLGAPLAKGIADRARALLQDLGATAGS